MKNKETTWVVDVLRDLRGALDAQKYEVARYHIADAIAAIYSTEGIQPNARQGLCEIVHSTYTDQVQ